MIRAAVLLPVVDAEPPRLLFVRRAAHLRRNPGQIAFPGGIVEPGDADDRAAALRECEEELGIAPTTVRVFARLEDVGTAFGDVTVAPFVGAIDEPLDLRVDPAETAAVHDVPLDALYEPNALHEGIEPVGEYRVRTWLFDHDGMHVWGATGRMLASLVARYPTVAELCEAYERRGSPAR